MSHLVRLRVELADSPGALAKVAAMIGTHGGNIAAVDVHDAHPDTAVDEILVDFPGDANLGLLRQELASSRVGILLSHQEARRNDPVVGVLRHAVDLMRSPEFSAVDELTRAIGDVCSSPAVWVCDGDEASHYEAGRFALERHGPVTIRTSALPPAMRTTLLDDEVWLLAVPDGEPGQRQGVVFVARPLALQITATEIARVEALIALHQELGRLRAGTA